MVKVVDDKSLTKLSGGVVDVEPFLVSRNTLGNGKTANSKSQRKMSNGGSGMRCGSGVSNADMVVVVDEETTIPK